MAARAYRVVSAALTPALRKLDERVLNALSGDYGLRARRVAQLVHGRHTYACDRCDGARLERRPTKWEARHAMACYARLENWERCAGLKLPVLVTTPEQARDVWQILRGLECVGRACQAGGWWRRT